jgi:hypothetical protein
LAGDLRFKGCDRDCSDAPGCDVLHDRMDDDIDERINGATLRVAPHPKRPETDPI